jgi:cell division protein FtsB
LSVTGFPLPFTLSLPRQIHCVSNFHGRLQYLAESENVFSEDGGEDRNNGLGDEVGAGGSMIKVKNILEISPADASAYLRKNMRQILCLALFALLVHDVFGPHGFIAMRRTQLEIEQIRQQIGKVNDENKSLAEQVNSLKTDPQAIERIAREEMGLARPGEMIFKLPDTPKAAK